MQQHKQQHAGSIDINYVMHNFKVVLVIVRNWITVIVEL